MNYEEMMKPERRQGVPERIHERIPPNLKVSGAVQD